jgi:hypothetical protein
MIIRRHSKELLNHGRWMALSATVGGESTEHVLSIKQNTIVVPDKGD